jgi:hypothetical protein
VKIIGLAAGTSTSRMNRQRGVPSIAEASSTGFSIVRTPA